MRCKYCNEYIEFITTATAYALICPNCYKVALMESEYGFGKYVPMDFFMGYQKIAELDYKDNKYVLKRYEEDNDILKSEKFPEAYNEAKQIIDNWLTGDKQ